MISIAWISTIPSRFKVASLYSLVSQDENMTTMSKQQLKSHTKIWNEMFIQDFFKFDIANALTSYFFQWTKYKIIVFWFEESRRHANQQLSSSYEKNMSSIDFHKFRFSIKKINQKYLCSEWNSFCIFGWWW